MYRFVVRNSYKKILQKNLPNHRNNSNYPRQAGFGKLLIILAPLAATGGVITYAKYDDGFRKTLVKNVPGSETILKIVLQEENNPLEGITKKVTNATSSVTGFFGGSSGGGGGSGSQEKSENFPSKKTDRVDTKSTITSQKPVSISSASQQVSKTNIDNNIPVPLPPISKPSSIKQTVSSSKDNEGTVTTLAPVTITKTPDIIPAEISELEKAVEIAAALAVQEYNKAIKILKQYNEDVRKVVDHAVDKFDTTAWNSLKNKTGARDTAVESAETSARNAIEKIDKCQVALSKVAGTVSHEKLEGVRNKIKKLTDHINGVKDELYKSKDFANVSEKYWKKVESARNYFIDEIESIFPGVNLAEKKLNLSKDDLDLFIMHAYSHVLAYQKELQRLQLEGEQRLKRAIAAVHGDDQNETVKTQLEFYLEQEKRNLILENQKKLSQMRADAEKELRKQLKRQSEAHLEHIHDALGQKETELRRIFTRELDEKISTEKAAYKLQLASMIGKLKGMDNALKERAESERCAHQAQSLWAACQALWATVRTGEPGVHWKKNLRPLKNEIKAVDRAAAEGDELVAVILENLPQQAKLRGVYPEDALRERFINVERVARKLALVPEEGASLPIYFLSFLQSFLIMRPDDPISKEELDDDKVDFSKLDTYDILNRARYFLDRGNFVQCLKYMNLLQGAPRKVAKDWLNEARLLLETQQAANTLMAHAAASGLLYL